MLIAKVLQALVLIAPLRDCRVLLFHRAVPQLGAAGDVFFAEFQPVRAMGRTIGLEYRL
jgi:hypothetical protein